MTAEEIKATLGLERHRTCGFVAETYRSSMKVPAEGLPDMYAPTSSTATPKR